MSSKRLNATRPLIEAPPIADDSAELICVVVPVPNAESYKAILLGVLRVAGKWTNYIESGTTRETEVAQFWNELIDMVEFDICDCVADCIDTSALVQSALANAIDTQTIIQNSINTIVQNAGTIDPDTINPDIALIPTRFPQAERDNNIHIPPAACDKDALWAGIRETVERLDDGARQFLEQAVAQADKAERAANIVSAIPLVGDLASALITTFSELAPDLLNLFNAYSSAANIDDTACAMFEIVCQECRYPTYQEYWNHYSNAGISGLDDIGSLTFTAITDLLFGTQNLAALVAYHTIISYQLYVLYLGSKFTSYRGTKWLNIWADIGEDNPDNGWELLCDGCADPVYPDLIIGRSCFDTFQAGTLQNINQNTWRISGTYQAPGPNTFAVFEDVSQRAFQITSVTVIVDANPFNDTRAYNTNCNDVGKGSLPSQWVDGTYNKAYYTSAQGNRPFTVEFTVSHVL